MGTAHKGVRLATYSEALRLNPQGRRKLRCPGCGALSFVPYIIEDTGEAVDIHESGRCDHQESCGYHLTPSEYWARYPERRPGGNMTKEERAEAWRKRRAELREEAQRLIFARLRAESGDAVAGADRPGEEGQKVEASRHSIELVEKCRARAEQTPFFRFLCNHFDPDTVREVFELYKVGGDRKGRAIFWQIDQAGEVHAGKIMRYMENGHREKGADGTPTPGSMGWIHAELRKAGKLPEGWQIEQCLFGAHLLNPEDLPAPVCLVEAEKTAIIGACAMPQFTWIATGGKHNLTAAKLEPLGRYSEMAGAVTVIPDLGSSEEWARLLQPCRLWLNYTISDIVEQKATPEARAKGFDIADYLLGEF